MILGISGWEDLFIRYQREIIHISNKLSHRSSSEKVPIVPSLDRVLDPFRLCPLGSVRLVVLGQDPYKNGATGLAFSTDDGSLTPSLRVLCSWLGLDNMDGNLIRWAKQGVLLLNVIPTMEICTNPISHRTLWEAFIRGCLNICSSKHNVAFLVLGSVAEEYVTSILDTDDNLVLIEKHPAYYARANIFSNKIFLFEQINSYLSSKNRGNIDFHER